MVEQLCPECQESNPFANRFCGQCGAALKSKRLALRPESGLTIGRTYLPAEQVKQIGQAVAVGLLTLLADASLAWLRRRVGQMDISMPSLKSDKSNAVSAAAERPSTELVPYTPAEGPVAVLSQRVVEVWQRGRLASRLVERTAWWRNE